jgi:hypothetical protein
MYKHARGFYGAKPSKLGNPSNHKKLEGKGPHIEAEKTRRDVKKSRRTVHVWGSKS